MGRMIRAALDDNWAEARELERRYARLHRRQLLGLESLPGEDGAQPDGPLHGPRPPAAGAALRQPPAPGWNAWPANWACSSQPASLNAVILHILNGQLMAMLVDDDPASSNTFPC